MKNLLLLTLVFICTLTTAQNIPNSNFENWTTKSYDTLDGYHSESPQMMQQFDTTLATKSTDAYQGNYSIRLETKTNGKDTLFGYFTSGEFGVSNGFSYTQNPDSIVGYFKCNVQPGDSAGLVILFSLGGTPVYYETFAFTGSQSIWSRFAFPLNSPLTPDSVFIGAASSNAINGFNITPGSWLMLDSLHFVGSGITQQLPNLNFENWTTISYEDPDEWTTTNALTSKDSVFAVTKTTDSYSQSYAMKIENIDTNNSYVGIATSGEFGSSGTIGGDPYNGSAIDTLQGYYKYSTSGVDTAGLVLIFRQSGSISGLAIEMLPPISSYTKFEVPFSNAQVPDSFRIDMASSFNNVMGSELYVDELVFKSILTSLDKNSELLKNISLYPNPAKTQLNLEWFSETKQMNIEIIDGLGRVYQSRSSLPKNGKLGLDVSQLSSGLYFLRIQLDNEVIIRRFVKE
ncbi:MAG: T9SS type A sorting domain-containing protein [Vicingaceae bacterium]